MTETGKMCRKVIPGSIGMVVVMLAFFIFATPEKDRKLELASHLNKAKTEKEFFEEELPAWAELYIGMAKSSWGEDERTAYQSVYWRNAIQSFLISCPTTPEQFPASMDDLRKSLLFPFIPYDTLESTPYNGDFLKPFSIQLEESDYAQLTPERRDAILKETPPGSLALYRAKVSEGESVRWTYGYALVWYQPMSKSSRLIAHLLPALQPFTEAQPLRCLANQMVYYILGYFAVTGQLPEKPEDLEKKVALLNPVVWGDKKQGSIARRLWDALLKK